MQEEIDQAPVVSGTIEFMWGSDDDERHMLINLDPDVVGAPDTFEIEGDLHDQVVPLISEGDRVEVTYTPVEHEIVDPDYGPSNSLRAHALAVKLLDR